MLVVLVVLVLMLVMVVVAMVVTMGGEGGLLPHYTPIAFQMTTRILTDFHSTV